MSLHVAINANMEFSDKGLRDVGDPNVLREHPRLRKIIDVFSAHVQDVRKMYECNASIKSGRVVSGMSRKGHFMHIARMPLCLWAPEARTDPYILHDKPKLWNKLKTCWKHWRTGGYQPIG